MRKSICSLEDSITISYIINTRMILKQSNELVYFLKISLNEVKLTLNIFLRELIFQFSHL